jgi:hypothetical protein
MGPARREAGHGSSMQRIRNSPVAVIDGKKEPAGALRKALPVLANVNFQPSFATPGSNQAFDVRSRA